MKITCCFRVLVRKKHKSIVQERKHFKQALEEHIKVKLKGMSPVDFRVHALKAA